MDPTIMNTTPPHRVRRSLLAALALAMLAGLLMPGPTPAEDRPDDQAAAPSERTAPAEPAPEPDSPDVDQTRLILQKWVETRKLISAERRDLAMSKETLNDRIELVKREIQTLRGKIAEAERNITETDKKRRDLVEENQTLKEASASLDDTVVALEAGVRDLLSRLPDGITGIDQLKLRVPSADKPNDTKLSLGDRFLTVVGILNAVNKFNREVSMTSELRQLPDGGKAEVTTLYVGIGRAFYVSNSGEVAGYGTVGPDGWHWTPANEIAPQVAQVIAILENEQVASFVQLPVEID